MRRNPSISPGVWCLLNKRWLEGGKRAAPNGSYKEGKFGVEAAIENSQPLQRQTNNGNIQIMGTFVGPPVPERIQKLRNLKREQAKASVEEIAHKNEDTTGSLEPPPEEAEAGSSSEDDGDFGPQLPAGPATAEEEEAALARLHERAADAGKEPESALGSDRSSWMSVALGAGSEREEITYNPKTFRRNMSVKMDKSWTEKASDRSKRQADEMMGLKRAAPTVDGQKKPKLQESNEAPPEDLRDHMPSLLDEHVAKRSAEQKTAKSEKGQGEGSFNWERDIQGKGRAANSQKFAAFVNQAKSMNDRFSRASRN